MFKTIHDRKIRLGLVGCGRISRNHFGSVEAHSNDLELAAVCDIDPAALRAHTEQYGVRGYEHLEDMLRGEELDVVALCTPSGLHPDQTVLAARHGVNVNVDFYSGVIYHLHGIAKDLFVPIFAVGRVPGWSVQVLEQQASNILIRPLTLYSGPEPRAYVPIADRG